MSYNPFAKNAAPQGQAKQFNATRSNNAQTQQSGQKNPFAANNSNQFGNQRQVSNQPAQGFNNRQSQGQPQIRFQDNEQQRTQNNNRNGPRQNSSGGKGNPFAAGSSQQPQAQSQFHQQSQPRGGSGNPFAQQTGQTAQMDMGSTGFGSSSGGRFQQSSNQNQTFHQPHQQQSAVKTNINPFQQGFQASNSRPSAPVNANQPSVFGFQGAVAQNPVSNNPFAQQQHSHFNSNNNSNTQPAFGSINKNPFNAGFNSGQQNAISSSSGFGGFGNRNIANQAPKMQFTQQDLQQLDVSSVLGNVGASKVQGIELNLEALDEQPTVPATTPSVATDAAEESEESKLSKAVQERSALWDKIMKESEHLTGLSEDPPAESPYDLMNKDPKTGKAVYVPGRIPLRPPSSYAAQ